MGKRKSGWQDHDYVLRWFGQKVGEARRNYRRFVSEGVTQGRRPDLVGGGLVRSQGGWSAVKSMRRLGMTERGDERNQAFQLIRTVCEQKQVSIKALRTGSRISEVSRVRSYLSEKLVNEFGLSLAETARQLGVTTAAIANSQRRKRMKV